MIYVVGTHKKMPWQSNFNEVPTTCILFQRNTKIDQNISWQNCDFSDAFDIIVLHYVLHEKPMKKTNCLEAHNHC